MGSERGALTSYYETGEDGKRGQRGECQNFKARHGFLRCLCLVYRVLWFGVYLRLCYGCFPYVFILGCFPYVLLVVLSKPCTVVLAVLTSAIAHV
jgi:hypothetical protein